MDFDLEGSFDKEKLLRYQLQHIQAEYDAHHSRAAGTALGGAGGWDGQYLHGALEKMHALFEHLCEVQQSGAIGNTRGYAYHLHAVWDVAACPVAAEDDVAKIVDALKAALAQDLRFVPGDAPAGAKVALRGCAAVVHPPTSCPDMPSLMQLSDRLAAAGFSAAVGSAAPESAVREKLGEIACAVANGELDLSKAVVVVFCSSHALAEPLGRLRELGATVAVVYHAAAAAPPAHLDALTAACDKLYIWDELRKAAQPSIPPPKAAAPAPPARSSKPAPPVKDAPMAAAAAAAAEAAAVKPSYSAALKTAQAAPGAKPSATAVKGKGSWTAPAEYSKDVEPGGWITQTLYLTRKEGKTSFGYKYDRIGDDGKYVREVEEDSAAAHAGLAPTMQILETTDRNELQRKLTVALLKVTRVTGQVTVWHKEWGNGKIKLDHKVTLKNTNATFETVMVSIPRVPRQDKVDTLRAGGASLALHQRVEFTIYLYKKADEPPTISARDVSLLSPVNAPFASGAPPLPLDDTKKKGASHSRR
eukprot:TRINITY_DN18357_c0_g1_i1.p1 TRINITY_DN18357_c0_g1~~TRINITY_DN18357_c0_g1_i1.p1  ORF type:complete len:532 (+),score=176.17 TRINITY_DN18357_c0_g1_i1:67-1662(+)